MGRTLTSDVITALTSSVVRPFYLFEAEFASTTLRLASTAFDISWDSKTWEGNGWFRGTGSIRETKDTEASGVEVALTGIPQTIVSLLLSDSRQNKTGSIYLGFFNSDLSIIADPFILWSGGLDIPRLEDTPDTCTVVLSYESELARLRKPLSLRYTDAAQKHLFPGDKGFSFVAKLANWKAYWGAKVKAKK